MQNEKNTNKITKPKTKQRNLDKTHKQNNIKTTQSKITNTKITHRTQSTNTAHVWNSAKM